MSTRRSTVLAVIFMLVGALSSVAASRTSSACSRVSLDPKPLWISSVTWWKQESKVLVVDAFMNKMLAYTPRGEGSVLASLRPGEFLPNRIAEIDDQGFLLELNDGRVEQLDERLRSRHEEPVLRARGAGGDRLGSMYDWVATSKGLVAYGALLDPANNLKLGFFRVSRNGNSLTMVKPFGEADFYLVGNHYLAAIDDDVYFVVMSKKPAIYRLRGDANQAERLKLEMPKGFETRADFKTHMTGPTSAPPHLAELETFSIPAGLYAQNKTLFLLTRNPDGKSDTAWNLFKINPESAEIVGSTKLPTASDFLTIVPGDESWFVFERGRVGIGQIQDNASMLVLASARVNSLSLPQVCPADKK